MVYIVKQNTPQQVVINQDRYELFIPVTTKNAQNEDVEVLQSIGIFSIAELTQRKTYLQNEITDIDDKIAAINLIINPVTPE